LKPINEEEDEDEGNAGQNNESLIKTDSEYIEDESPS
jgi:hypothetical protein